jgi:hypothetical protein
MRIERGQLRALIVVALLTLGVVATAVPVAADSHGGPWPKSRVTVVSGR